MVTNSGVDGTGFRMRRPRVTSSGFVADVDPIVKSHLDELNTLLGKPVFMRDDASYDWRSGEDGFKGAMVKAPRGKKVVPKSTPHAVAISKMLARKLTAKHVPENTWQKDSLADALSKAKSDSERYITLTEHIDATPELAKLKYTFTRNLSVNEYTLDANLRSVLVGYPAIVDYLVAYGYYELRLRTPRSLIDVLHSSPKGAQTIVNYAAISGARSRIFKEKLDVENYNGDGIDGVVKALLQADLPLSEAAFSKAADLVIDNFIFNSAQEALIMEAAKDLGPIPPALHALLVRSIRTSPFPIDKHNAKFFVSQFILQNSTPADEELAPFEQEEAEGDVKGDFDVNYLADERELVQVSQAAVKCAAQLFYGMVLGDELDVFNVVNFFTHRYLVRGQIDITKRSLRNDLESYVFNGRFPELDKEGRPTGRQLDRTRPAERHMFYRQVFNYGGGPVTDDVIINPEFKRLWNVLMLESARYLERAQLSPHPDSFVSRTNVMQAVEDLQYNLSISCTGMASVITPIIYKELDFVVRRIFMNPEVLAKVAPGAGSWTRVVENLYMDMKHTRPKATILHSKAKLGHLILRSISTYNPETFEDDKSFSEFISSVDAFITTQSILKESLTDDLKQDAAADDDDDDMPSANGNGGNGHAYLPPPVASGAAAGHDEWDF